MKSCPYSSIFRWYRYADRLCLAGVATYFGVRTWACVENLDISYPAVIGGPGLTAPRPESWSAPGCPRPGLLPAETKPSTRLLESFPHHDRSLPAAHGHPRPRAGADRG